MKKPFSNQNGREQWKNLGSLIYGLPHCLHIAEHICVLPSMAPVFHVSIFVAA